MRILCVCDHGCNRSVHIAHRLKFQGGHDTLAVGVQTASPETLRMLERWAELIILTDSEQARAFTDAATTTWVWSVRDGFPRPFHPGQDKLVRRYIDDHRERLIALDGAEPVAAA